MKLTNKDKRLQSIVEKYITYFEFDVDKNEYVFWGDLLTLESKDEDFEIIKTKTFNILNLMNEEYKKGEEAFSLLQNRDFHTDVWFRI